ncbi:SubName: Full=Uncharacterized protein {ECO:0000313/EMBL:CCA76340.1} [Serendipita indica DSM 11827]|uniref:Uncharacterized protein n=1 Tax=Serendipita indica (strain DSM 11827) TaxID=1109443 RepID=G4TYE7_SERID|nr:SubName: Full=Uncharacterized protein {ECO:0000313/EMBL:CCA76340.1} [Serendipita indica DSM 11827]CCA76340.1 hypothetical protein PIIN_10335 [Serendipita indica DSM 11827]
MSNMNGVHNLDTSASTTEGGGDRSLGVGGHNHQNATAASDDNGSLYFVRPNWDSSDGCFTGFDCDLDPLRSH